MLVVAWCTHVALVVVESGSGEWFHAIHCWYASAGDGDGEEGDGEDGDGEDGVSRPASAISIISLSSWWRRISCIHVLECIQALMALMGAVMMAP